MQAVFSTIRLEWAIDANALSLAGDKVRYVDQLVKENGALLLPRYPAALLFPDKGKNTAAIEVTFMYERLEKPCCSRCMQVALGITVLVAVIVRLRGYAVPAPRCPPMHPKPTLPLLRRRTLLTCPSVHPQLSMAVAVQRTLFSTYQTQILGAAQVGLVPLLRSLPLRSVVLS